jgi:uncharacterized lipoprotein YmbA
MVRRSRIAVRFDVKALGTRLVALGNLCITSPMLRIAAGVAAMALAGCASSPVTLVALPPPAESAPIAAPDTPGTVLLREVTLPQYLDSFPVLVGRRSNVLLMSDNTEWAERLPVAATRVLRDALSQRLGPSRILLAGERRPADAELAIEFMALDPGESGLNLDARWQLSCRAAGRSYRGGRIRLQAALESARPAAVASATTDALARLAAALADDLQCDSRSAN